MNDKELMNNLRKNTEKIMINDKKRELNALTVVDLLKNNNEV